MSCANADVRHRYPANPSTISDATTTTVCHSPPRSDGPIGAPLGRRPVMTSALVTDR